MSFNISRQVIQFISENLIFLKILILGDQRNHFELADLRRICTNLTLLTELFIECSQIKHEEPNCLPNANIGLLKHLRSVDLYNFCYPDEIKMEHLDQLLDLKTIEYCDKDAVCIF